MPRALDILIAAVALAILSPFLLAAAIAIKLGSRRAGFSPPLPGRVEGPGHGPAGGDADRRPAPDDPRPGLRLHAAPASPPPGAAGDHRLGPGPGPRRHPLGGADRARRRLRRTALAGARPPHPRPHRLARRHRPGPGPRLTLMGRFAL